MAQRGALDKHRAALAAQEQPGQDADGFFFAMHADESKKGIFLGQCQQAAHDRVRQEHEVANSFGSK